VRGLNWTQLAEMLGAGMTIGSHTVTHPNLPSLQPASVRRELLMSRRILEDGLGTEITSFAYPFGKPKHNVNLVTRDLVRETGFRTAATVNYRALRPGEDPFRVPRFSVTGDSLEELAVKVEGGMDLLGWWQQRAPRWLSHLISPEGSHRKELSVDTPGYA
jgi:peptidoglycan/xylan/chitin deacetylase (PgdA/CDA1 family)